MFSSHHLSKDKTCNAVYGFLFLLTCYPLVSGLCSTCLGKQCYDNGECIVGCVPGYVGKYCDEACPSRCLNKECGVHLDSGLKTCTDGCESGYCKAKCEEECPEDCVTCDRQCGTCNVTICPVRQYGSDCSATCNSRYGKCDRETGQCLRCRRGYYGDECTRECRACFTQADNIRDTCLSGCDICKTEETCRKGSYGQSCDLQCSSACTNPERGCNKATGECFAGCVSGHYGAACNYSCNENCMLDRCNQITGQCSDGCVSGYHGLRCNYKCENLCVDKICNQDDGICSFGCVNGYKSISQKCEKPISEGSRIYFEIWLPFIFFAAICIAVFIWRRRLIGWFNQAERGNSATDSEHQTLLRRNGSRDRQIRTLRKRTQNEINSLTPGMVNVSAVKSVVNILASGRNWVTITGNAGDGKTILGYLAMKHLSGKRNVYRIEQPEEYTLLLRTNADCVIMFDDRFGDFTSDQVLIDKWKKVIKNVHDQFDLRGNRIQIIFISRKNVVNETQVFFGQFHDTIINHENSVDLSSIKNTDERLQILDYYLDQGQLTVSSEVRYMIANLGTASGFPKCCRMYPKLKAMKHDLDIVDFFTSPLAFLDITTAVLYKESCKELFELMIKNNGQFDVHSVEDDTLRASLLKVAREQEGSYVIGDSNGLCAFAHQSIYESVLSVICDTDPMFCVKYVSLPVITQRVTLTSDGRDKSPTQINVKPVQRVVKALAERSREDILDGDYNVFSHRFCENKDFCTELVTACTYSGTTEQKHGKQDINQPGENGDTMLWTALLSSRYAAVYTLLKNKADVTIKHKTDRTPLQYLCQLMNDQEDDHQVVIMDAIHLIISEGGDINICDQYGQTPLHYLFKVHLSAEDITKIIRVGKVDLNQCERYKSTPLHYLCAYAGLQMDSVDLVIKKGEGNFNKGDEHGTTPLHFLCGNEKVDFEVVFRIVKTADGDINKQDDNGITPLHVLCSGLCPIESIMSLIKPRGNIDMYGNTALHFLCKRFGIDADMFKPHLKQLPEEDMKMKNSLGYTPMDYLTYKENGLPWSDGLIDRSAADLVICGFQQRDKWIDVLGPTMTFNSEKVNEFFQVRDSGQELTNIERSSTTNRPGRFLMFNGTCSRVPDLPFSPSSIKTPLYLEINSSLTLNTESSFHMVQIGVVEGKENLDTWGCVSGLPGTVCLSVTGNCQRHDQSCCIQVWRKHQKESKHQVNECVTLPSFQAGTRLTLTLGLVLDVGGGRVAFIDLERMKLLCKVDLPFTDEVFPMFFLNKDKTCCPTIMRLISGRKISVDDRKKQLIRQALSN